MVRKCLSLLLCGVLLLLLLTACGAETAGSDQYSANDMPAESPAAPEGIYTESGSASDSSAQLPENRKLIRTVYIRAETRDMTDLLNQLDVKIAEAGGYVENRVVYSGNYPSADLTIRIPVEHTDSFLDQVEKASNVLNSEESLDDVTLTYVATESRQKALLAEEERLLEFMELATTITELLEIESRLTDVRSELEVLTSQLRVFDNQIDYATIHLYLSEVEVLEPVGKQTVGQRMGDGFMETLSAIGTFFVELSILLVAGSPALILLAVLVFVVILLIRRGRKNKKKNTNQPPYPPNYPPNYPPAPPQQ